MNSLVFPIAMALSSLVVTITLVYAPTNFSPGAPLGVRVPAHVLASPPVRNALHRYRRIVLIGGALTTVLALFAMRIPLLAATSPLLLLAIAAYAYAVSRKDLLAAKQREGWFEGIETAVTGRISSQTSIAGIDVPVPSMPWLAIIGALAMTAAGALTVADRWEEIPDVVPTHWGAGMEPDAWANKTIGTVFVPSFLNLGLIALLVLISWSISASTVHQRSDRSLAGQLRNQFSLAATNSGMGYLFFILSIGLALLQICSALPAYQDYMWIGFVVTVGGSLVGVPLLLMSQLRAQTAIDTQLRAAGLVEQQMESPDNDEHFKWGVLYYNPEDPAVFVSKRFGTGISFNYARWQAKVAVVATLLLVAGLLALAIFA